MRDGFSISNSDITTSIEHIEVFLIGGGLVNDPTVDKKATHIEPVELFRLKFILNY